jgi:hypothetical protein
MQCTKCHQGKLSRTKRVGLLEEDLFPFFGYFPWICSECKSRTLVKARGQRVRIPRNEQFEANPSPRKDGLHQVQ